MFVCSRVLLFSWVRGLGNISTQMVEMFQRINSSSIFEKSLLRSLILLPKPQSTTTLQSDFNNYQTHLYQ